MTPSERINTHNTGVDTTLAKEGRCAAPHPATGRRCRLPARHAGGCVFTDASAAPAPRGLSLDVRIDIDRHDVTAFLHGAVHAGNVDDFHHRLGDLLGVGARRVTLDIKHAHLSDQTGPAALADFRYVAARNDVELHIVAIGSTGASAPPGDADPVR